MLKKLSIRWRVTLYSAFLLTFCCVLLTIILGFCAFRMADSIDNVGSLLKENMNENTAPEEDIMEMLHQSSGKNPVSPEAQAAKWIFGSHSLFYMFLIILGGTALTYYITGKALRPLLKLNAQVRNMTVSHLSVKLPVTDSHNEIAELIRSFNEMTDKLNDAFLAQQNFSANAAHELRTPLTVLQTKVDVFKKSHAHTTEEYDALIAVFESQIARLRNLVKTLLDMTNIDDLGEQTPVPLDVIFEDIMSELTPLAAGRKVTLSSSCQDYTVTGNLDLLYRAFYNLIENGIKYNREYGSVSVTAKRNDTGQVEILICDTGIGIPTDMKKHIFEPFFRVDKSRSREMGGNGLGLALVKRIIDLHGGTIAVGSNIPHGTIFYLRFPQ